MSAQTHTADVIYGLATGVIAGGVVGLVGSLTQRTVLWAWPVGLIGGLLMVLAMVVFLRGLAGRAALAAGALALWAVTAAVTLAAEDSVVVLDMYGIGWLVGAATLPIIGLVLPMSQQSQ